MRAEIRDGQEHKCSTHGRAIRCIGLTRYGRVRAVALQMRCRPKFAARLLDPPRTHIPRRQRVCQKATFGAVFRLWHYPRHRVQPINAALRGRTILTSVNSLARVISCGNTSIWPAAGSKDCFRLILKLWFSARAPWLARLRPYAAPEDERHLPRLSTG